MDVRDSNGNPRDGDALRHKDLKTGMALEAARITNIRPTDAESRATRTGEWSGHEILKKA